MVCCCQAYGARGPRGREALAEAKLDNAGLKLQAGQLRSPREDGPQCWEDGEDWHRGNQLLGAVTVPSSTPQGLELLKSEEEGLIIVCGVHDGGPWGSWNRRNPENQAEPGDRIVSANGKGHLEKVWTELTRLSVHTRSVTMSVQKPIANRVKVLKGEADTLGLVLLPLESGLLFIDSIGPEGLVHKWNSSHAERKVRMLDQIVEVNGVRGHYMELVLAMATSGSVELVVMTHVDGA